jgi:hypothetical protein
MAEKRRRVLYEIEQKGHKLAVEFLPIPAGVGVTKGE